MGSKTFVLAVLRIRELRSEGYLWTEINEMVTVLRRFGLKAKRVLSSRWAKLIA